MFGLSKLYGYALAAGGAVLAILAAVAGVRRGGRIEGAAQERAKTNAANTELIDDRRKSDARLDALSDADVDRRLSERWNRKP